MSYTKNLSVKEMYASVYQDAIIKEFLEKGLEQDNVSLAISALEELILRGDSDIIVETLDQAFKKGQIRQESALISMIGRVLKTECRELNRNLVHYGTGILHGDFMGPSDWMRAQERQSHLSRSSAKKEPMIADEIERRANDFDRLVADLHLEQQELH